MGRSNKKEKPKLKPEDYYSKIMHIMIDSPAWRHLSGNAVKTYLLMRRVSLGIETRFFLKYNEIQALGIDRRKIKKILNELIDCGFIELVDLGGRFKNDCHWNKSYYAISDRWQLCTKDYRPGPRRDMRSIVLSFSSSENATRSSCGTATSERTKTEISSSKNATSYNNDSDII